MPKDCSLLSNKQAGDIDKREILLNLFILNFKKFCIKVYFNLFVMKNLKKLFAILIRDVDYLSFYIRLINQNYINFVGKKIKLLR